MRHPATTTAGARGARDRESDCHGYDESGDQFNESHDDASQFAMNELPKNAGVIRDSRSGCRLAQPNSLVVKASHAERIHVITVS
jgi:hypothetical protein